MSKIKDFFVRTKKSISNFLFKNRYGTIMMMVGAIVLFWDLLLKFLTDNTTQTILKNVLSFTSSHNTGGAWSIFSGSTVFLIIITILFMAGIVVLNYFYKNKSYLYAIAVGLFLSGGFGNLLDRIRFGYVRDFIRLEFMNFPIFNIADIAIVIGVVLLFVHFIFLHDRKKERDNPSKELAMETQTTGGFDLKKDEETYETETATDNMDTSIENSKTKSTAPKKRTNSKTNKNATNKSRTRNSDIKHTYNTKKTSSVKRSNKKTKNPTKKGK